MNGGQTWQRGETIQIDQVSAFYPSQLYFIDQKRGWMLCESDSGMHNMRVHFFSTRDGGSHWNLVYDTIEHLSGSGTLWIKGYYPYQEHFAFSTDTTGFFSDGKLFDSLDGGKSWVSRSINPPGDIPDIDCQSGYCKYLDTISGPAFTSEQDGVFIRRVYVNSDNVMDVFIYYPNTLNRLPLPVFQYLYFTHDSGRSWVPYLSPVKIGTVTFLNSKIGWLLGKNDSDSSTHTILYKTADAGDTWAQISADVPLPLGTQFQFVDEQIGFAFYPFSVKDYYQDFDMRVNEVVQKDFLFYTHDGGRTWEK